MSASIASAPMNRLLPAEGRASGAVIEPAVGERAAGGSAAGDSAATDSAAAGRAVIDPAALFADNPVIASVKDESALRAVLASDCAVVFVLFGSILTVGPIVERIAAAGKVPFVDVDLLDGFSNREVVVQYLAANTAVAGILSAKAHMVRAARVNGLLAIHRFFLIDSFAYHNLPKQVQVSQPDAIEILPGCMPRVISWVRAETDIPLIAGGLVCDKEDVVAALGAGAVAVASSNRAVWTM